MTGLPRSTIQKNMSEQANPTMDTMEKLAAGLKVGIESLYKSDYK